MQFVTALSLPPNSFSGSRVREKEATPNRIMSTPVVQLAGLQTEHRNPRTVDIDRVPTLELCGILNREDSRVPSAVEPCITVIAEVIDVLSERVRNGGRVFYIGAGTSGR